MARRNKQYSRALQPFLTATLTDGVAEKSLWYETPWDFSLIERNVFNVHKNQYYDLIEQQYKIQTLCNNDINGKYPAISHYSDFTSSENDRNHTRCHKKLIDKYKDINSSDSFTPLPEYMLKINSKYRIFGILENFNENLEIAYFHPHLFDPEHTLWKTGEALTSWSDCPFKKIGQSDDCFN